MNNISKGLIGVILVSLIVTSRALIDIPNVAAVASVALFSGFLFGVRRGWIIPVAGMLISDFIFEGFYDIWVMLAVYVGFVIPVFIGNREWTLVNVKNEKLNLALNILGKSILGSIAFFVITNLAVWISSGMYTLDFSGLSMCFANAIPFFRNTCLGDMAFNTLLFGSFFLAMYSKRSRLIVQAERV